MLYCKSVTPPDQCWRTAHPPHEGEGKHRTDPMTQKPTQPSGLPFPRRWLYYIAIKIVVLAVLVYVALRWKGLI